MTTKRQAGFTLFEGIVSIVIVATIGYVLSQTFNIGVRNYFFGAEVALEDSKGRLAFERVTRDLGMIRSASDIGTMSATQFTFTDTTGVFVNYQYNAVTDQLTRAESGGTARVLADTISSLTFSYLQSDAVSLATTASLAFIQLQLTITSSNVSAVYRTTVEPLGL